MPLFPVLQETEIHRRLRGARLTLSSRCRSISPRRRQQAVQRSTLHSFPLRATSAEGPLSTDSRDLGEARPPSVNPFPFPTTGGADRCCPPEASVSLPLPRRQLSSGALLLLPGPVTQAGRSATRRTERQRRCHGFPRTGMSRGL